MMTKTTTRDAVQIGVLSLLALALYFILPDPVSYKGSSADLLPLANYFTVGGGISGIMLSIFIFLKKS